MAINLTNGWTSKSLAPRTGFFQSAMSGQTAKTGLINTDLNKTPTPPGTPSGTSSIEQLQQAALGTPPVSSAPILKDATLGSRDPNQSMGVGKTGISSSTYAHPNAPAFLADAVNNLNGGQGFAQQNLANLLLAQILGGVQNNVTLHESQVEAQKAADDKKIAEAKAAAQAAKAEAAANAHAAAVRLDRLQGGVGPATGLPNYFAENPWTEGAAARQKQVEHAASLQSAVAPSARWGWGPGNWAGPSWVGADRNV